MRRVLVLGLARSGRAAQAALEAGGTEVVAADRTLGNDEDVSLLDGVEVVIKSPGVPGEAPLVAAARGRGIPVWSEIELASRLLPNPILGVTGTNGKTTTTELLGAMLGCPHGRQRRHRALGARRRRACRRVDRLRALELPARGRRPLPAADRRAAQPRARPPRPPRRLRVVPGGEAADLREPERRGRRRRAARLRHRARFGPTGRVRRRRRAAGRAADPRRAQPRERGRRDGGSPRCRARRRRDR